MQVYPPNHLVKRVAGDQSVEDFVRSFEHVRSTVRHYLATVGHDLGRFENILDFGCGVGRFLFALRPELKPTQRLYACDVHEECARWCQQHIDFAEIQYTAIHPPLPYKDGQFDFIYALSVFTHLRLDLQFRWALEIYRILRPGGVFFVTLHGPFFFPILFEVFRRGADHRWLSRRRPSQTVDLYTIGDDGLFLCADLQGRDDQGQIDVAAAHSAGFASELFAAFELNGRFPESRMAAGQDVYVFQKPAAGFAAASPGGQTAAAKSDWTFPEPVVRGTQPGIELQYAARGQRTFRVYPRLEPAGFYAVEADVEIRAGEVRLAREPVRLNTVRAWGSHHLGGLKVEMPPAAGDITVRLKSRFVDAAASPADGSARVVWSFPYLV